MPFLRTWICTERTKQYDRPEKMMTNCLCYAHKNESLHLYVSSSVQCKQSFAKLFENLPRSSRAMSYRRV